MGTGLGEIVLYRAADGGPALDVRLERDTAWLTQAQMAELFGRERSVLTKHVNNVFKEGELDKESNVQILHIAGSDKPVTFYNLDVIISVGYRVKSQRGTQSRIWATNVLRQREGRADAGGGEPDQSAQSVTGLPMTQRSFS